MKKLLNPLLCLAFIFLFTSAIQSCSIKADVKAPAVTADAPEIHLEFIGATALRSGLKFQNTEVGGLSGLDYDALSDVFYAISDDRGGVNYPRFYSLKINIKDGELSDDDISFLSVKDILAPNDRRYSEGELDPESIRYHAAKKQFYWSSEGSRFKALPPVVRAMNGGGNFVNEFPLPANYHPKMNQGIRDNKSLESLTLSADKLTFFTATETALYQDGPEETSKHGSAARVAQIELSSGKLLNEYIYQTEAIAEKPFIPGLFATNGLVELLAIAPKNFIAVERSFTLGKGNTIRLYLTTTQSATNIKGEFSIEKKRPNITAMPKKLILDLDSLQIPLDNIEAISFGPMLENGKATLVLVSDNNFNASAQKTQFIAFKFDTKILQNLTW